MRILVNPFPVYEFMAASLIQGWMKLGHEVLTARHIASYAEKRADPQDQNFDLSVQFITGEGRLPGKKSIFMEVVDFYPGLNDARSKGFDHIFVRDHLPDMNCIPINYGIEDRFYCATDVERKPLKDRPIDVCFLGYLYPQAPQSQRIEWLTKLKVELPDLNMVLEDRKFTEPDEKWSRWTLSKDYTGDRAYCFAHDPHYFETLATSKICLSLTGLMADTGRSWEIMASGAIPMIEKYTIGDQDVDLIEPEPMAYWFGTAEELVWMIRDVMKNIRHSQQEADEAFTFNREHHSSVARAQYVLNMIGLG
jgi:hypothetical protein